MRNCLIVGSGRCGTSMAAGVLARSGYYMGDRLLNQPTIGNRKGQFESVVINDINEELLRQVVPLRRRLLGLGRWLFPHRLQTPQLWLSRLPVDVQFKPDPSTLKKIKNETEREPFCFKDTRFAYTLDVWRPYLKDTVFICVFRDPSVTAQSIMAIIKRAHYLRGLSISFDEALEIWQLKYKHILEKHRHQGEWLFLHYNQVLTDKGLNHISAFTNAPIDRAFPDTEMITPCPCRVLPREVSDIYEQLCSLAGYSNDAHNS